MATKQASKRADDDDDGQGAPARWIAAEWQPGTELLCCTVCAFDTLDGATAMEAHWAKTHTPAGEEPPLVQVFNTRGRAA